MDPDLDRFRIETLAHIRQLQQQIDAQQLVIAWLMARDDPSADGPRTSFLLHQSLELADNPNFLEYGPVFDALFEDSERFVALSGRRR
jgi:hypothetical protein